MCHLSEPVCVRTYVNMYDSQSRSGHGLEGGAGLQDILTDRPSVVA